MSGILKTSNIKLTGKGHGFERMKTNPSYKPSIDSPLAIILKKMSALNTKKLFYMSHFLYVSMACPPPEEGEEDTGKNTFFPH